MELTSKKEPKLLIVTVQDTRIDAASALRFKDEMRRVAEGGKDPVLLDLHHVEFIDSSGLGAIVATMKLLAPARQLVLAGFTPTVEKVFKLTRMDTVFRVHTRVEDAVAAMQEAES